MSMFRALSRATALVAAVGSIAGAQTFTSGDQVIRQIWTEGMGPNSQAYTLSQVLSDSIGPRLTGTPGIKRANDWIVATYKSWGVEARNEEYGKWKGWRRGTTHIDLMTPRVRTLEGTLLADQIAPDVAAAYRVCVLALDRGDGVALAGKDARRADLAVDAIGIDHAGVDGCALDD